MDTTTFDPYWRITAAFKSERPYAPNDEKPIAFSFCVVARDAKDAVAKARAWCGPNMTFDMRRFAQGEGF